jgi:hypothetical protein
MVLYLLGVIPLIKKGRDRYRMILGAGRIARVPLLRSGLKKHMIHPIVLSFENGHIV